jgi:hypothetical protein
LITLRLLFQNLFKSESQKEAFEESDCQGPRRGPEPEDQGGVGGGPAGAAGRLHRARRRRARRQAQGGRPRLKPTRIILGKPTYSCKVIMFV